MNQLMHGILVIGAFAAWGMVIGLWIWRAVTD